MRLRHPLSTWCSKLDAGHFGYSNTLKYRQRLGTESRSFVSLVPGGQRDLKGGGTDWYKPGREWIVAAARLCR